MPATVEQYTWFRHVAEDAYGCRACPRMDAHTAVLGPLNGRIDSRVLFIGEAPGRFGSATTRIPFHGDRSGENFERLLPFAGLRRDEVFITNAVMCNPRDERGRNDTPLRSEMVNCSAYLRQVLDIVHPAYVVTLGRKALDALAIIKPHDILLQRDVATALAWRGVLVVPLYHPSARVVAVRGFQQMAHEHARLGEFLRSAPAGVMGLGW